MVAIYTLLFSKEAKKDSLKVSYSKLKNKVDKLLDNLEKDPFHIPPPFKPLSGEYYGCYSRRINKQHRIIYQVDDQNRKIRIIRMWSHYGDN